MKLIMTMVFFVLSTSSFANLYLQTEYREGRKAKIITKHHIFLEKRYIVDYTKKSYVLFLKKINKDEVTIETESYDVDKKGHKTMQAGSLGTYRVGKSFTLNNDAPNGDHLFSLKIVLEKIVPTRS